jgi:mannosyltransferase OCH1-like enzyme
VIPRVFHRIWLGPSPLPDEFRHYGETWRRHNPGWEERLWSEETLPSGLHRHEVYELLRQPAERSDILRLELLDRHGGVYVDTDFECVRPLEPLIDGLDFFCAYLKPGRVNNAIIGAVPGHPIIRHALRELRPRTFYGMVDKDGTGPLFFNRIIEKHPYAAVFERSLFYPQTAAERAGAVAIHHAAQSWKDEAALRKEIRRLQKLLANAQDELEAVRRGRVPVESIKRRLRAIRRTH